MTKRQANSAQAKVCIRSAPFGRQLQKEIESDKNVTISCLYRFVD